MTKLERIETLIQKISCPVCLRSQLQVDMNGDPPHSPCEIHAECGHCNYKFIVTDDVKEMEDAWLEVQNLVERRGCPKCLDRKLSLEFLCDVESENCFFLVRCNENNHYSRLDQKEIQYLFN